MIKRKPNWVYVAAAMMLGLILARADYRELGYKYLSPLPGAEYTSPQTRFVLVRFADVSPDEVTNLAASFITVTGAITGSHNGQTHVASDARTVTFQLSQDFTNGELVTVALAPQLAPGATGTVEPYQYQFMISARMPGSLPIAAVKAVVPIPVEDSPEAGAPQNTLRSGPRNNSFATAAEVMPNGVSVPGDFPQVVISANTNPSPGRLFLENVLGAFQPYTMILDNNGLPVWYQRGLTYNFKVLQNGMITWCVGDGTGGFPAFDQSFSYLRTYFTVNGYLTDFHDVKVLPDGSYFMIGYRVNPVDMSRYVTGGSPRASVRETVIQGFTAAGELTFQWRAWDNYDIRDQGGNTDFPHMNELDIDDDGQVLVSARHLSEVTKINRDSGEIIWRLGGAHSSFTFVNDPLNGISYQHDISALGNGHYLIFDNGNYHNPQVSRAVEYELDLTNLTAQLFWQFRDKPDKYTYWRGNCQRLSSGNTLINFSMAQYPKVIEVDTNGVKRFELSLVPSSDAYKAFRFPWTGVVAAPYLIVEPQADNVTLVYNKFGDTNVAYYRIYGGTMPQSTNLLASSEVTLKRLTNLQNGSTYYFRVTAVNQQGVEGPYSNEERVTVDIVRPGQNMIGNGDFSQGTNLWIWALSAGATAAWSIDSGASHIHITNGGIALGDIQLKQTGKALVQGNEYVFQFDAWSSLPRYLQAKVAQDGGANQNYSEIASTYVTPVHQHYQYVFTMTSTSDLNASVFFNLGSSACDVYLDNVSLFNPPPGDLNLDGRVDLLDLQILSRDWLKRQSGLSSDFDGDGKIDFHDFGILGDNWSGGN